MPWLTRMAMATSNHFEISIALKATVVIVLCLAGLGITRHAKAAVRHLLLIAAFMILLALPIAARMLPAIVVPLPESLPSMAAATIGVQAAHADWSISSTIINLWYLGIVVLLLSLAVDTLRLYRIRQTASFWVDKQAVVSSVARRSGINRPVDILLHNAIAGPLTFGILRPVILFPDDALNWNEEEFRRALIHEMEHVRRGDWFTQLIARIICIGYWPHPLVWVVRRRLSLEAECSCDDAVIETSRNTDYAEQLVKSARRLHASHAVSAVAMARRSDLAARVASILDDARHRGRPASLTRVTVLFTAIVMVLSVGPLAAIRQTKKLESVVNAETRTLLPIRPIREAAHLTISAPSSRRSATPRRPRPTVAKTTALDEPELTSSESHLEETRSSSASSSSSSSSENLGSWSASSQNGVDGDSLTRKRNSVLR